EGRVGYVKKTVVLNDLMRPIIEIAQKQCHDKGLTCEFHEPPQPLPVVRADAQKMRLAFTKLVENAIQYTPKGGHVAVELKQEGSRIRFEVTDTGIGIPKADQPNIGKGFFRASNAFLSEPDASGVGLAIVTYIVNEQDGVMGFTSKEGQGSTFWFEIPIISLSNKTVTKT
ncbi:MAG TPA: HAMP domain-containing sensor histidine kinase, partial [Candidatus Saccharimonadales bacterium]